MHYLFHGLSITLINGRMQYTPAKPNQRINKSTDRLFIFHLTLSFPINITKINLILFAIGQCEVNTKGRKRWGDLRDLV